MIQLRTTPAQIGIDIQRGQFEIRQPPGELSIQTTPMEADIQYEDGTLEIDQSRAWDALAIGSVSRLNDRIYSQAKDIALRGIARIVENGNRLANITNKGNPIAEIAREQAFAPLEMVYPAEASMDNVDIHYTANEPYIRIHAGTVSTQYQAHAPEIHYTPAKVSYYLQQKNSLEVIPPQIDYKI
ncbi:DUF6470 family protein [Gorillibacterium sp. sgz5001074]|uniref:DUF6470 family protein n=1 Tax=Gorillibacterium sp. sgz5001074 TaxID=3446695 RepID=UPI003F664C07